MRFVAFLVMSVALAALSVVAGPTQSQQGGGGEGNPGGLGGPDVADQLVRVVSKGNDPFAIADAPAALRTSLEDFARASKIDNGMISRKQFQAFYEIVQLAGGGFGAGKGLDIDGAATQKFRQLDVNNDGLL